MIDPTIVYQCDIMYEYETHTALFIIYSIDLLYIVYLMSGNFACVVLSFSLQIEILQPPLVISPNKNTTKT